MRRLKVLLSAYACAPSQGSELGVGWGTAREMANHHEVWVLTQSRHRQAIEAELDRNPVPGLWFAYYELPRWVAWWRRGQRGVRFHSYLWQFGAYRVARNLQREAGIELAQHVTFATYLRPSLLALLPVPFVWGPVGGGETAPKAFRSSLSLRGRVYEAARDVVRWWGEHDPFVRLTARRCALALAATEETAVRLRKLGIKEVRVLNQVGLGEEEVDLLRRRGARQRASQGSKDPTRFASVGRLLHWKGVHLGLRAFARAKLSDAEYWIIGDGPEQERLRALVEELGIASHQVRFWGRLPRDETLRKLGECHVLVHPSLHDSGGYVCLEAMALGLPVVCLDLGGPAVQVVKETGFRVQAVEPEQALDGLAAAMSMLSRDRALVIGMGEAAQRRVDAHFDWRRKGARMAKLYEKVLSL